MSFVPADFDPPRELVLPELQLVPLDVEHNDSDHAAWSSSIAHIRATPGFESGDWPPLEGMSLDDTSDFMNTLALESGSLVDRLATFDARIG